MEYQKYSAHWQRQVRLVADRVLGTGYFGKSSEIVREPNTHMLVCVDKDDLLGFSHGRLLPKRGLRDYLEHRVDFVPDSLDSADNTGAFGVIQSLAVAPEHQGKGVGSGLLSRLHDLLVGHGADKIIASFKHGPSSTPIHGIMKRMGFEFWLRLETNFRDRCNEGEFACPDRTDQCNCDALFFRKNIY